MVEIHLFLFFCFLEVKITLFKYYDTLMCACIYTQLSMHVYKKQVIPYIYIDLNFLEFSFWRNKT